MSGELFFFQWTTALLLVAVVCWVGAFAVVLLRKDSPLYKRGRS